MRFDVLDSYFETLKPFDIHEKILPKLNPGRKVLNTVDTILDLQNNGQEGPIIGIAPGSRHQTKRWNEESFAGLADKIASRGDIPVFLGDKNDMVVIKRIGEYMTSKLISLAGEIDLALTIGVISHMDGFITNDSGPMHIAGALDIPLVAMFGPTHPDLGFWPGYRSGTFIHSGIDCSPCSLHGFSPCRMHNRLCMDDITVEKALEALDEIMGN
ncbi:MAG TPA: glycosyltransferase family 9 protein [bacterium]|nr:glycosyltransferase family 9 protein [bacterium]